MLASIMKPGNDLPDGDIYIYLSRTEIESLETSSLVGEIFEFSDVRKRYPLEIGLGEIVNGSVTIDTGKEKYVLTIPKSYYPEFVDNGFLGGRYGSFLKFDIFSDRYAAEHLDVGEERERIRSRWDNRDRIAKKLNK